MTPKRILAAFDGSPDANEAFETAVDAALCTARLQVVSVATLVSHAACSVLVVRTK